MLDPFMSCGKRGIAESGHAPACQSLPQWTMAKSCQGSQPEYLHLTPGPGQSSCP